MTLATKIRILIVLASFATVAAVHAQDVNVRVRGRTVTADGVGIAGVSVQAFRYGEAGRPVVSDRSGEYAVGLASGAPITRIEYRHSAFDLAEITFVSGSDPKQRIVKVMYKHGQSRSVGATADTLAAYEQFGLNASIAPRAEREHLANVVKEFELLPKLSQLPIKFGNKFVNDFLIKRRNEVLTLFDQRWLLR